MFNTGTSRAGHQRGAEQVTFKDFLWCCGFLVFGGAAIYWAVFSDGAKRIHAENVAHERALETPHVIRQADGCKVYAFKDAGSIHYFTRCPESIVTTERTWTERQGKMNVEKHEEIETRNIQ